MGRINHISQPFWHFIYSQFPSSRYKKIPPLFTQELCVRMILFPFLSAYSQTETTHIIRFWYAWISILDILWENQIHWASKKNNSIFYFIIKSCSLHKSWERETPYRGNMHLSKIGFIGTSTQSNCGMLNCILNPFNVITILMRLNVSISRHF